MPLSRQHMEGRAYLDWWFQRNKSPSWQDGCRGRSWELTSWTASMEQREGENTWGMAQGFGILKPMPHDILPPGRSQLLDIPRQLVKCCNAWAYWGYFSFKPHKIKAFHKLEESRLLDETGKKKGGCKRNATRVGFLVVKRLHQIKLKNWRYQNMKKLFFLLAMEVPKLQFCGWSVTQGRMSYKVRSALS